MTHRSRTIISACIVAIIAFFIGYAVSPRTAQAPAIVPGGAPAGSVIIPISIVSLREDASSSPTVAIEYPQFPSLPADFNEAIASSTLTRLADFRQSVAENEQARQATGGSAADISPTAYSFDVAWQPAQINSQYVSFIVRYDAYSGGANEDEELQTFDYDIADHQIMSLGDLFPSAPDYLDQIATLSRQQLSDSMSEASDGNVPTEMLDMGTEPTADDFADFTFTDHMVTIYFPKYAVAPGSFGEQHVDIPLGSIK